MSTRSQIIRENPDGTYTGAYIHCDGYPSVRGLECLAAKQEGLFSEYVDYIIERDGREAYEYGSYNDILEHVRKSDLEWVYILHANGIWTVLDVGIRPGSALTAFDNTVDEIAGTDSMLTALIITDDPGYFKNRFDALLKDEREIARKTYGGLNSEK